MWDAIWVFYVQMRMRFIHFEHKIFVIWINLCPTFIYYLKEDLNAVANSLCMPCPGVKLDYARNTDVLSL